MLSKKQETRSGSGFRLSLPLTKVNMINKQIMYTWAFSQPSFCSNIKETGFI